MIIKKTQINSNESDPYFVLKIIASLSYHSPARQSGHHSHRSHHTRTAGARTVHSHTYTGPPSRAQGSAPGLGGEGTSETRVAMATVITEEPERMGGEESECHPGWM